MEYEPKSLFGGAITATLPKGWTDGSLIREIPDNQEVFTCPQTPRSMIIELLEYQAVPDQDALRVHFEEITRLNEAANTQLGTTAVFPGSIPMFTLIAQQVMGRKPHPVQVFMGLIRLPQAQTDIIITVHDPQPVLGAPMPHDSSPGMAILKSALQSFTVNDWSLFA
ncbi:putative ran guanine nucleotide release factor [Paratrimastix pyriformis]|uniref:Ran guanine nucleotide release factor n=1 Tax=Paratrimastix pyriformis TaxID=342808 RepID=A0ABQ8UCU6_9EUKA|nr:putative ran guanine nucleotide release factor [Paratrimastix pyriformis]